MLNSNARKIIIKNFQSSLRTIRLTLNYSVSELAEIINVPPQTVNELESGQMEMTTLQYIAVAAFVDNFLRQNPEYILDIQEIVDGNGRDNFENYDTSFSADSLLEFWFEDFINLGDAEEYDLQMLAAKFKIFLDAEILMTDAAPEIVGDLIDAFEDTDNKIILPLRSIEEVQRGENPDEISQALKYIRRLQEMDFLQIQGEDADPDFHDTILTVFSKFRGNYRLCLITENESLAQDVLKLNDAEDSGFKILVGIINDGNFVPYNFEAEEEIIDEESIDAELPTEKDDLSKDEIIGWEEL